MIQAFPKVFTVGTDYIKDIFEGEVEVTEKIDGSQFAFGNVGGEVLMRSKGKQLFAEAPEKMFAKGVDYVQRISHLLPEGIIFYSEFMRGEKHNSLKYGRVPKNNIMMFGAMEVSQRFIPDWRRFADELDVEPVPVLFSGRINGVPELMTIMDKESVLGGTKMEGIVVKNYEKPFLLGGQPIPVMAGKLVSEKFKEVHRERWGREEKKGGRMEAFLDSFRTEARWEKAVQRLAEAGELLNEPKDIGALVRIVQDDISDEEKAEAKEFLWKEFKGDIFRRSTSGLPEWYKARLADRSFGEEVAG